MTREEINLLRKDVIVRFETAYMPDSALDDLNAYVRAEVEAAVEWMGEGVGMSPPSELLDEYLHEIGLGEAKARNMTEEERDAYQGILRGRSESMGEPKEAKDVERR